MSFKNKHSGPTLKTKYVLAKTSEKNIKSRNFKDRQYNVQNENVFLKLV